MISVMDNNDTREEERRGVKRKMGLSRCDVCETEEAKYRCPNCIKHTCSLACVKQHKMSLGCSGVRDKTAFVSLSQFDEMNLLSDYRFLEDTDRLRQRSNRDDVLHASLRHPKEGMWLIRRARAAKVTLKILPKLFSRHRENTTTFRRADGRLHWHLKIHFPQSGAVYSERFPDNREIRQILHDYIHPSESDPVRRQKLKVYVHSPQEDIKIFMKSEQTQPKSLRYHELDPQKTLGENLMHKTVVEYPEIFVVLKQHSQEYLTPIKERSSVAPEIISRKSEESVSKACSHVAKKAKIISDADELEDGEIRSDDESDEDDDVTEKTAPDTQGCDDDEERDEERDEEKTQDSHMSCPPEERVVSQTLGDVGGQTETLSRFSQHADDCIDDNIDVHDMGGANANIYASDCHIYADGTSEKIHDSIDTENVGFASQSPIPQDIQSETDSHANISDSMGGENANIYSSEGHISAVVHSEGVNQANVDSVDDHSANVYASDSNIATDIHVQGSNQSDVCENANICASDSCTPEDIHDESSAQANIEIANICASDIAADMQGEGVSHVYVEDANVYASNSCISTDIQVEDSGQANVENANICASDSCTPEDIHDESSTQANIEIANICASDIAADIHVEGSGQANVENANVYACEGHFPADIPSEDSAQVNIGDSVSDVSGDVSYQTVCETEPRL